MKNSANGFLKAFIRMIKQGKLGEEYRLIFQNLNAVVVVTDPKGTITYMSDYVEKISHYRIPELIGRPYRQIIAPESMTVIKKAWLKHRRGKDIKPYEVAYLDKNGDRVYCMVSTSLIRHNNRIIGIFGLATDITKHRQTTEHLSKMVKELSMLYDIGTELTFIMDIDLLFFKILMHLKKTFGYERAAILLTDELKNELIIRAAEKPFPRLAHRKKILIGKGITGLVAKTGKPRLVTDVTEESKYLELDPRTRSEACVPLKAGNKIIGVINVESYKRNAFDEDDIRILTLIANQAAVAIENSRLYKSLEDSYFDTIKTLVSAMEAKDHETRGHSDRVRRLAIRIARYLNMRQEQINLLNYAGYLHDIGKIGISDFILNKKDPLTKSEYRIIRKHPVIGHNMLRGVGHLREVCKIIRSEHEKYDGSGYPDGLFGREIPIGARIIAVADAFDAMTTDRPYRLALPKKEAIKRIKNASATQFDPNVVKAFLMVMKHR